MGISLNNDAETKNCMYYLIHPSIDLVYLALNTNMFSSVT